MSVNRFGRDNLSRQLAVDPSMGARWRHPCRQRLVHQESVLPYPIIGIGFLDVASYRINVGWRNRPWPVRTRQHAIHTLAIGLFNLELVIDEAGGGKFLGAWVAGARAVLDGDAGIGLNAADAGDGRAGGEQKQSGYRHSFARVLIKHDAIPCSNEGVIIRAP